MSKGAPSIRYAEIERDTPETKVRVVLDLDGGTRQDIRTGIGFFDHMLGVFAFHGYVDLGVDAEGNLELDDHHTVEAVGLVLGQAFCSALVESDAIVRHASNHTAMDDALVLVSVDVSGRGRAFIELGFCRERIGGLSTENIEVFLSAFAKEASMTIHVRKIAGTNDHHVCEALFKGLGMALHAATRASERRTAASTKGRLG